MILVYTRLNIKVVHLLTIKLQCIIIDNKDFKLTVIFDSQLLPFYNEISKKSIELVFTGLHRLNLTGYREKYLSEIYSCYLSFYENFIVWSDDERFEPYNCSTNNLFDESIPTFVLADKLKWRFLQKCF